jgi:UDP-N-acetylmuramyl pentapeptide phosphotransferase/UDP-N-acetylglucosamine-1-phosphate transferase
MLFILIFLVSFFISFLIYKFKIGLDVSNGIQKFHTDKTPRLGGLSIFLAFFIFSIYEFLSTKNIEYLYLLLSSFPVFLGGLLEDITKKISPKKRLIFASVSAVLSTFLFKIYIYKLDIPIFDNFLEFIPFAYLFTVFAIAGVSNAYNIVDGFNGLSSSIAILVFLSFAYMGYIKGDEFVFNISLAMIFAIIGFLVLNYPLGKIFLGDGGAYFIGFIIGFLSVYIVYKYRDISPWYPLLLSIYPIFETIYSMYRRKFIKKLSPTEADAFHLHTLFYRRLIPKIFPNISQNKLSRNSLVMPFVLMLMLPFVIIANTFWNNSLVLIMASILFIILYISLYRAIIKFKIKKFIFWRRIN